LKRKKFEVSESSLKSFIDACLKIKPQLMGKNLIKNILSLKREHYQISGDSKTANIKVGTINNGNHNVILSSKNQANPGPSKTKRNEPPEEEELQLNLKKQKHSKKTMSLAENQKFSVEESKDVEFKSLENCSSLEIVNKNIKQYIYNSVSAMLNSAEFNSSMKLCFGINDDGIVTGIPYRFNSSRKWMAQ